MYALSVCRGFLCCPCWCSLVFIEIYSIWVNTQEPKFGGALTAPMQPLTEREIELLQWMAGELSNKEIVERLVMSAGTVKVHMRNLFAKLQVNNGVKTRHSSYAIKFAAIAPAAE
jgi:ATP/maltotriose-dependent transcriptional regulator MalT